MTSTELAPSFLDATDLDLDGLPSVQLEPARLNWYHGVDAGKIKTPGVFFGKETAFNEPPPAPWELDERYVDTDGPGYSVDRLRIAILDWRKQWFIPSATDNDKIRWLPNGSRAEAGVKVKKQLEYLILVDGLPDAMVLSVSGFYKSRPFEEIVRAHERGALAQLIRAKKRRFPRWAHWLTIGGKVDSNGKPVLEKAKDAGGEEYGSIVTPPVMLAAPTLVSADVMRQGIETWNLYNSLGWLKFQRGNRDDVEAVEVVSSAPQLPAPRNVPQPVEEGELAF